MDSIHNNRRTRCPAGCGKLFISEEYANKHADVEHAGWNDAPKRKGWVTPYGFIDFFEPVTFQEACDIMKEVTGNAK